MTNSLQHTLLHPEQAQNKLINILTFVLLHAVLTGLLSVLLLPCIFEVEVYFHDKVFCQSMLPPI